MGWRFRRFGLSVMACLVLGAPAWAQIAPAPSQVAPPVIIPPSGGGRISLPQAPAGATVPEAAKKLRFKLLGFDVEGEFEEFAPQRKELEAPLIGKTISVAQVFEFANKLEQLYIRAGYPLVRVVILPQEFEKSARIKLRVVDGFIERMDFTAIAELVRARVAAVLAPLVRKTHLKQSELERRLLLAGETPGLILNATFAAGKEVGGTVLVLTGRYRPVSVSVYSDDAMPATYGTGQIVTSASLNSVLGFGEQFTASAAGLPDKDFVTRFPTRRYLSAGGSFPIGIDGLKLEGGATDGVTTPRVNLDSVSQGLLVQGYGMLSYEAVKLRDFELTFDARFDATDEQINTLVFEPVIIPLNLDRLRVLRGGVSGIWRLRESGTTISFGSNYSRGLNAFGARLAADADQSFTPLSRQGADAVFNKWDGRIEINQSLPQDFFASFAAFGQTSFHHALLTSEQFDLVGAKMLSGFTAGALPGDTTWVMRGEIGRPFTIPIESGGLTLTPYGFAATGERILEDPTILEIGSIHATNFGGGVRFNLAPWSDMMPNGYGFIEYSHRYTNAPTTILGELLFSNLFPQMQAGDRIFAGVLLQY